MAFDLEVILTTLEQHRVEFILVGGVAAAAHGAPIVTQDVDILYRYRARKIGRLKAALDDLDAVARGDDTDYTFEDLRPHSKPMQFGDIKILVLDLARLIELKRELGRPKDIAVLAVLEATLRELERTKA